MPKRAAPEESIDPVRSRLAAAAAAPVARVETPPPRVVATPAGEGSDKPASAKPRPVTRIAVTAEALSINRKIMVTPQEAERINETTALITAAFGSKVTYSQISRAMWSILAGAEEAIKAGARRAPRMKTPSKGNPLAMAEYEQSLTDFLAATLKRS